MDGKKLADAVRRALPPRYCSAVIVAAGSATRMGGIDKVMAELGGEPMIVRTVRAFQQCAAIREIVIVTREDLIRRITGLCGGFDKVRAVIAGGDSRAASVRRGLNALSEETELAAVHEDYELVDGYIISRNSNQWNSTMTVSRGSSAGIAAGMCAITANGEVVGLVTEVGSNYAVIKTVLDSSLEVSATMSSSGYSGVVQGGYATGNQGLLRMDYLPSSAVIRNNDQVVTAGSTVYPRNLVLGHVVDAGFDDTGVAKFALLEPAADIANLEQVFIITQYDAS